MCHDQLFEKVRLAGSTCLGGSTCYPSPSVVASCFMIEERWVGIGQDEYSENISQCREKFFKILVSGNHILQIQ